MEQTPKTHDEQPRKKVRHYSLSRLARETVSILADSALSLAKHRGQMMVRVESPRDQR